jgi:hypothetical protein
MPGERFTHLYLRPPERAQDSGRARHRVGALFRDKIFTDHAQRLAPFISREIGVSCLATANIHRNGVNSFAVPHHFSIPLP